MARSQRKDAGQPVAPERRGKEHGSEQPSQQTSERPALRLERVYAAAREEVWRAWTDPQALRIWFGPGRPNSVTVAETDVRVGGRMRIGFDMPDGQHHEVRGVYLEVDAPRRLAFTWAWVTTLERESRVSIDFLDEGGATRMKFLHEQFYDQAARDDHEGGWTTTFEKLEQLLHEGQPR